MTNEALLDKETSNIIKRYMVLYKLIFQYSLFFIPLIAAFIRAYSVKSSDTIPHTFSNQRNTFQSYSNNNGIYKAVRVSDEVGPILDNRGDVKILGGDLQATGNVLIGRNNLISLAGIILPNKPYIVDFSFTGDISSFDKNYDINTLKRVLDNRILSVSPEDNTGTNISSTFFTQEDTDTKPKTSMEQILDSLKRNSYFNPTIPPDLLNSTQSKDFIKDYNLSCINSFKIYNGFCDGNVNQFIQKLPDLKLDGGWDDILLVASKLHTNEQVQHFCSNIMANILANPYPNLQLDKIMGGVCVDSNARYNLIKDFLKVQNELDVLTSQEVISNNVDANAFKLVSLRQKIVSQNRKKSLDTTNVVAYIKFVDGLIHQDKIKIPQFYIDGAYYFNNVYLKGILKNLAISSIDPSVKTEIATMLDMISSLNKGNDSISVRGLEKMVVNQSIVKSISDLPANSFATITNFQQVFSDTLQLYPEIHSSEIQVDETTKKARVVGNLQFYDDDKKEKNIQIIINFDYRDNGFQLSSIRTPNNPTMDNIISVYLSKNPNTTLGTILEIIKSNNDYIKTVLTICDSITVQRGIQVGQCTTTNASITVNTVPINFTIANDRITTASSPNKDVQTYLDKALNGNNINRDNISKVIVDIIGITTPKQPDPNQDEISSIDSQKLAIIAKFKKFLNLEPNDIVQQNGKWITTFTLKNYEFATVVDIEKNYKLSPLVLQVNGQVVTVKDFSLTLIPFSQNRITQFLDDPMAFIKQVDSKSYDAIQKAANPSK